MARSSAYSALQAIFCLGCLWTATVPAIAQESPEVPLAYVGEAACTGCHTITNTEWSHTVHAKIFSNNPRDELEAHSCEACHGPGDQHIMSPFDEATIIRFTEGSVTPVAEQNGMCMTCHDGGQRIHWMGSAHEGRDIACSDCHNPMAEFSAAGMLANVSIVETCFGCHQTERAQFQRRSHMPLAEGKMSCMNCHNPHGTLTDPLIRTDTVNETCYQCHAEKRGPFLFEHAPVRDSCMNCHTPHGSNHAALLVTARPILCQQCHSAIGHMNDLLTRGNLASGSIPDPRVVGRSCQNCHTQIHGSNHPAGSRFHR